MTDRRDIEFVVGIGASAGGLESIEGFFKLVQEDTGNAYVIMQHLSPDYKSFMPEILARKTKMVVKLIEDKATIEPNTIFLLPPKKNVTLEGDQLCLVDIMRTRIPNKPIDLFFSSLAKSKKDKAIGVVLSGSGSDGSIGVVDINKEGGIVYSESPQSAKFDSMPNSAILTGIVDYVGTPEEISSQITGHHSDCSSGRHALGESGLIAQDGARFQIFRLIQEKYGVDFSQYKTNTVTRRLESRIVSLGLSDINMYLTRLQTDPAEVSNLYYEILIGVTSFFRDTEAFQLLEEKVIPGIVAKKNDGDEIRIWGPGCASGEEIYSLLILFHEEIARENKRITIKAFASDIDDEILAIGSEGKYKTSVLNQVPPLLLDKYFSKTDDGAQILPLIRKSVVFVRHNLLCDPPFNRIDLVSCRNLLIYFGDEAQRKALSVFYFSLLKDGSLCLGPSETLGRYQNGYDVIDRKWKIYQKKVGLLPKDLDLSVPLQRSRVFTSVVENNLHVSEKEGSISKSVSAAHEILLQSYVPRSVLVSGHMDILHYFGDLRDFLTPKPGSPSLNLRNMVDEKLASSIYLSILRVQKSGVEIAYRGLSIGKGEDLTTYNILVRPTKRKYDAKVDMFLICFEKVETKQEDKRSSDSSLNSHADSDERMIFLQQELQETQENLQSTIEELETTNEELQSTNEELLASNEELQSTNEELHSVNEELHTVNSEYQKKIEELIQLTADEKNFINASDIGILFVDEDCNIRKFTPKAASIFNLLSHDIGRPIQHISHRFESVGLAEQILHVSRTSVPVEMELEGPSNRIFIVSIRPYILVDRSQEGVVISIVDATKFRETSAELEKQKEMLKDEKMAALSIASDAERSKKMLELKSLELEQSNDELEQYACVASHDLQAPIRHVTAFSKELCEHLGESENPEVQECLDGIVRGCRRMEKLIQALLSLARVGKQNLCLENIDLNAIVDEVFELHSELIKQADAKIEFSKLPSINGDRALIGQLVQNLVGNALKFGSEDRKLIISITSTIDEAHCTLVFEDNGVGIPKNASEKIFEIFQMLEPRRSHSNIGTGIGLAICKKIVAIHSGTISAESKVQGTKFIVNLPIEKVINI